MAPPPAAAAQSGLSFVSNSTWTADPVEARVHVFSSITVKSHAADVNGLPGFYTTLDMTLPASATAVTVVSADGLSRPPAFLGQTSSGTAISIPLGQRLYAGQTASLVLRFDLVDAGGSTDRDLRIGQNLMSFPVSAFGSPNTPGSTVTVVFPSDFTVQEEFGSLTRSIFGSGQVVFTSGVLDDATTMSAWFTAVQPVPASDFRSRTATIGPLKVTLRYWSDDPGWADAVQNVLSQGLPDLQRMIGLGDPANRSLTVTEASSQEIGGFAGAFDQANGQVQVSYLADPFVILHEAAHMWFNDSLVSDRWIEEGFASYYAEQVVLDLQMKDHAPQLSAMLRDAAVPFNDWVAAGVPGSATEKYLYGATLSTARDIVNLAGPVAMQQVWREAQAGTAAYQPEGGVGLEAQAGPVDWRRFLDLLELTTGRSFEAIWEDVVVTPTQAPLMAQRLASRETYQEVLAMAGTWTLPAEIRRALDGWQFDQADSALAEARTILTQRGQIASRAIEEQTAAPPTLEKVFETSTVAAAALEARAELSALDALSAAREAKAASNNGSGFGLLGSDPNADLTSAREAFARGDLQSAESLAQNAQKAWQGGYAAQLVRLLGILAGSLGLLMLLSIGLWSLVRRAGALGRVAASPAGASDQTGAVSGSRTRANDPQPAGSPGSAVTSPGVGLDRLPILALAAGGAGGLADAGGGSGAGGRGGASSGSGSGSGSGSRSRRGRADGGGNGNGDDGEIDEPNAGDASRGGSGNGEDDGPFGSSFGPESEREESAYDLLRRGQALLRDRHNAQAAVVLERAARVEPGKGSILEALGRAYFNSGQHLRAAETFEALLEVDPSAHYGHFALGLSFARLGRDQEARTHLRLAVALDPASETYRRALERVEARTS